MDQSYEKKLLTSPYKSPIKNLTSPLKSPVRDNYSDRFIPSRSHVKWKCSPSYDLFGSRNRPISTKLFSDHVANSTLRTPDLIDPVSLPAPSNEDLTDYHGSNSLPSGYKNQQPKTFDIMAALLENELIGAKNSFHGIDSENIIVERKNKNVFSFRIPRDSPRKISSCTYMQSHVSENSQKLLQQPQKQIRSIPKIPYKVLDAPELQDDFYLNLVDWSSQNMLAVGLGSSVYLWSAYNSQVVKLCDSAVESDVIASVAWYKKGTHLAVGTYRGRIQLWDVNVKRRVRVLTGHEARVGALAWNCDLLASGSRDRYIILRDIRASSGSGGGPGDESEEIDINGACSSRNISEMIHNRRPSSALSDTFNITEEQRAAQRIRFYCRSNNLNNSLLQENTAESVDVQHIQDPIKESPMEDEDYFDEKSSKSSEASSYFEISSDEDRTSVMPLKGKRITSKSVASLPPNDPLHAVFGSASGYSSHCCTLELDSKPNNRPIGAVRKLHNHKQEVCGLRWSPDNQYLASGGNDNRLLIWDPQMSQPVLTYDSHVAAVKAIAWSPHKHGLLASGGGTADRTIRFWNILTGQALKHIDTASQVCNLAWSEHSNEFVSTHGYSQNQIVVWKYPSLTQIAKLVGHTYRVLFLAMSPDGENIVTGAGDETLRFWHVFDKTRRPAHPDSNLSLFSSIR